VKEKEYESAYLKERRSEQQEKLARNMSHEQLKSQERLKALLDRFKKADEHRRDYFNSLQEQQRYKSELARLKEDDKSELQARLKRLADNKKMAILLKEREHAERIEHKRLREEGIRQIRSRLDLKTALEKQSLRARNVE
jgi:hypothetical protein